MIMVNERQQQPARGFTLIEVMVALTVVSIGMLGIASLYTQALGAARTTQYRSQATNLLTDMADRIRGNRLGGIAYAGIAADNNCDLSGGATCTPPQMAAHDLFTWGAQVNALLPAGAWNVARNGATLPPTFTITVQWDEVGQGQITAQTVIQVPTF
jgi:type IV pilus assembly protein PilV